MIIQCPKCGNLVSDKATTCPSCGTSLTTDPTESTINDNVIQDKAEVAHPADTDNRPCAESTANVTYPISAKKTIPSNSWVTDMEEPKNKNNSIVVAIVATALASIIGVFFLLRFLNSPNHKLSKVPGLFDKMQYGQIVTICDDVRSSFSSLSEQNKRDLAIYYGQLSKKSGNKEYQNKFLSYVKMLYDLNDTYITKYLDEKYPDEINHIRIDEAYKTYSLGKIGNVRSICDILVNFSDNLSFTDRCDLASLLCAIGHIENDNNLKKEGAVIYTQTCSFNENEAKKRYQINDEKLKINISTITKDINIPKYERSVVRTSGLIRSVVVTGTNVRVRKGPGLNYDPITDYYGMNIHPDKGQRLEYLGETEEFYRVRFSGYDCWISKQFTIASANPVE